MRPRAGGFSFIELIFVVAILGILLAMTIPGIKETTIRKQVKDGMALADVAEKGVAIAYGLTGAMPANNEAAGLPPPEKMIGSMVTQVAVENGAVTLTFGNNASASITGKHVTLRPAIVVGQPIVPIAWICNDVAVPNGMEIRGENATDIPKGWLPVECRGIEKK